MFDRSDNKFVRLWEAMSEPIADILEDAWSKGVCEGLELAIDYIEDFSACPDLPAQAKETGTALAKGLRQCQLAVQIDDLEGSDA